MTSNYPESRGDWIASALEKRRAIRRYKMFTNKKVDMSKTSKVTPIRSDKQPAPVPVVSAVPVSKKSEAQRRTGIKFTQSEVAPLTKLVERETLQRVAYWLSKSKFADGKSNRLTWAMGRIRDLLDIDMSHHAGALGQVEFITSNYTPFAVSDVPVESVEKPDIATKPKDTVALAKQPVENQANGLLEAIIAMNAAANEAAAKREERMFDKLTSLVTSIANPGIAHRQLNGTTTVEQRPVVEIPEKSMVEDIRLIVKRHAHKISVGKPKEDFSYIFSSVWCFLYDETCARYKIPMPNVQGSSKLQAFEDMGYLDKVHAVAVALLT